MQMCHAHHGSDLPAAVPLRDQCYRSAIQNLTATLHPIKGMRTLEPPARMLSVAGVCAHHHALHCEGATMCLLDVRKVVPQQSKELYCWS